MPGPYNDALGTPQDSSWYHYSSGSILGDLAFWGAGIGVAESAAAAYAGRNSFIFNENAKRFFPGVRSAIGRRLSPWSTLDRSAVPAQYFAGGQFRQFDLIRDAHRGSGVFRGTAGSNYSERLANKFGSKFSTSITRRAALTMGIRTAWTALNFGLGKSLGRGIGDIIANYENARPESPQYETGGFFADTRASFTQRQRAIRTIHNSQLTTRAALGNEAAFLHM